MAALSGFFIFYITLLGFTLESGAKMVDMTHRLNKNSKHYQLFRDFEKKAALNESFHGIWVFANEFYMNEHTGTHIDAPAHTHLGGRLLHKIPIERLVGPAVVFDLREKAKTNIDYALSVEDIKEHEKQHGLIEEGSIIFINSDGAKDYWDTKKYYNSETPSNSSTLHFPGFGAPATDFLIQKRKIKGIASDRMSFDCGNSASFPVHKSVSTQDTWGLENVNRVGELPERGATVFVMPILIEGGSGGPIRLLAFTDMKEDIKAFSSSTSIMAGLTVLMVTLITSFRSLML